MSVNRIAAVSAIVAVALSLPFLGRTWNVFMHVLGAILFMGNIVVGAAWMSLARRARQTEALRLGVRGIVLTDAMFTLPGAILLVLNGGIIATPYFRAHAGWVFVSLALFVVSGAVWGAVLVPIQRRLLSLLTAVPAGREVPGEVEALLQRWFRLGGVATLLPLIVLVLMVFKPRIG